MAILPSTIDACKLDLFASEVELKQKYPIAFASRIMRLREMYNYWLANPSMKDSHLRDELMKRYDISQSAAYSDINIIHQLVPLIAQKSKAFHRARANEMFLETYAQAKADNDLRTMERVAASYAKYNNVDCEDEKTLPYEEIKLQPFCATMDITTLGIKPIPDIYNYISKLSKELLRDNRDIEDVSFEEPDLEEHHLFAPIKNVTD